MASCILKTNDVEAEGAIDLDELFERRHARDLKQLSLFNKVLNRAHKQIRNTTKFVKSEKYTWFQVPEILFGEHEYNAVDCCAYVIHKLQKNGFSVQLQPNNWLYISWYHYVPYYVRDEFRRVTGLVMNENGEIVKKPDENDAAAAAAAAAPAAPAVRSTKGFKPGNFIYREDLLKTMEERFAAARAEQK